MSPDHAEEYTQSLGQMVNGGWRQIALGVRLGVPDALGLTVEEWVTQRLGGYVRLDRIERRQAVAELAGEMSQRQIGSILGVDHRTVGNDAIGENSPSLPHRLPPFDIANNHVVTVQTSLRHLANLIGDLNREELDHLNVNLESIRELADFLLIQIGASLHE